MSASTRNFAALVGFIFGLFLVCFAERQPSKKPITVTDCVRTRRIFEGQVELSPAGNEVAYVVIAPDIEHNQNRYRLYIRDLERTEVKDNGRLVFEGATPVHAIRWPSRSKSLFFLEQGDNAQSIKEFDPGTGKLTIVVSASAISCFSVDATGNMIVFSTIAQHQEKKSYKNYEEFGYPVVLGEGLLPPSELEGPFDAGSTVLVARRQVNQGFEVKKIGGDLSDLHDVSALAVSPNGRFVTFNHKFKDYPPYWKANPYVRWCASRGIVPETLGIYDFEMGKLHIAFDSPGAGWGHPVTWADDSRGFGLNALSPEASQWERRDMKMRPQPDGENWPFLRSHTFVVQLSVGKVSEVVKDPLSWSINQIVSWKAADGRLLFRKDDQAYEWLQPSVSGWLEAGDSELSVGPVNTNSAMYVGSARLNAVSDGEKVVGVFENTISPPNIFVHDLSARRTLLLTDLNPELGNLALGSVETLRWRDRHGYHCNGFLIKPVGYISGNRYPLVIMTKTWWPEYFLADTAYHTAFAPQPLASVGFLVLLAPERPAEFEQNRGKKYPGHDPGRMNESRELEDVIESGMHELVKQRLADPNDIGLVGFSTTSWKTDILLTHSRATFRAASSADSGLWNYGLYWSANNSGAMRASEDYMGGPPYGTTVTNWRKFSPAFNANGTRTPLLMEYTSGGRQEIDGLEFFIALRKQGRPAELFFYPHGVHVLENPSERIASLQRNVDWFRFWMQHYEGLVPDYDPGQYIRWRLLKQSISVERKGAGPE